MNNKHYRNELQAQRQKARLPMIVGKASASGVKLAPDPKPVRTVHISELTRSKMVGENERKYRNVIDGDALIEWVGFGWIMIRPATPEDRRMYPTIVRGSA